jgi:hypothetical protein
VTLAIRPTDDSAIVVEPSRQLEGGVALVLAFSDTARVLTLSREQARALADVLLALTDEAEQ